LEIFLYHEECGEVPVGVEFFITELRSALSKLVSP
jgi:hypothetical protein